ncbi:unnamed protein product, partial [marine sediment metagenome]
VSAGFSLVSRKLEELPYRDRESVKFRVNATRADKRFALTSMELDREVADRILPSFEKLKVDLKEAEIVLGIDVREQVYVFTARMDGPRGLPSGTGGNMLALLSGGIDSPVAAYLMMRRGTGVDFINYHSPPYIGEKSKDKVIELARILKKYQYEGTVYFINFTEIQTAIKLNCEERYRTILFRRAMMKIASEVAREKKYSALITGEVLGQVASQI